MRVEKCRKLLQDIAEGTLPNLVFTDEKKFNIQQAVNQKNDRVWVSSSTIEERIVTRRQNPQSVMMWAAVTAIRRSLLLFFVPTGVKLKSERYISDILEGCQSNVVTPFGLAKVLSLNKHAWHCHSKPWWCNKQRWML